MLLTLYGLIMPLYVTRLTKTSFCFAIAMLFANREQQPYVAIHREKHLQASFFALYYST